MSNLLKRKLRGKTIKIFGPPGTGKTENLLKRVQRYLKKGYSPDEICYVSFTNKAVDECVSRVRKKFKEYDEDDFKYFRTLHSLARQQFAEIPVLDPKADLLMFHTQYGTVKVKYKDTWDDQKVYNNWSLQIYDRARNMKVDPVQLYKQQSRKSVRLQQFKSIINGYEQFKTMETENGQRTPDRLDFTDMVERYITNGLVIPFKVLMVDEAQDLTPLQWDMIVKIAKQVDRVYIAGDDDQAIYEWNGADVTLFQTFPGRSLVLKRSVRLNKNIHFFSKCLLHSMGENRVKKEFYSNGKTGAIYRWNNLKKIPWDLEGSWMVLARINDVKKELQEEAKSLGLYFQDVKNNKSFDPNQYLAIQYWEKIVDGGSINREEACTMYEYLLNIDHGYRSQDSKKWSFAHPNQVFTFDELHLRCGMRDEKSSWKQAFKRKFKDRDKKYFNRLMSEGVDLNLPPKIIIDTIHQVKGGEAENVVLASKCNFPSHFDKKNLTEKVKELRVWYTGATRTKNTLHLLGTYHQYHFPLGKYFNLYEANYDTQRYIR
jgi:superfamily I DNA/RNA helicase